MSGRKAILDSNIIIYLSKGILDIEDIMASYDDLYISIITYLEVMGFRFSDEADKEIVKYLLNSFEMINIVPGIAENVISIRQQKKMKLPDAIILATAKFMDCDLLTRNVNDFLNIVEEVNIVNPFGRPQSQEGEEIQ